ncbi:glycosyltransferase [Planktotalea sp.]|uniref:glycosyltransferase n=1 Tax=Planktotalea sp. TaxID=2029877 RepID=UPI003D6C235E
MFSTLSRLFQRYCDHHYSIPVDGFTVYDANGGKIAQVERICFGQRSVRIEGWSISSEVALGYPAQQKWVAPDILRSDVTMELNLPAEQKCGFNLAWFDNPLGASLSFRYGGNTTQIMCPQPGRLNRAKALVHIRFSFAKDVLRASSVLLRAFFNPNLVNKTRAKRALRMEQKHPSHILDARVFEVVRTKQRAPKVTLIMPVFNAFEVMQNALNRVAENTDLPWRLILVEDCSSDPRVRPFLRRWCAHNRVKGSEILLLENSENLGFIGSVNKAFERALEHNDHVVLINSDALVPKQWATRLIRPILTNSNVASVTPFSNDAEILSAPIICGSSETPDGVAEKIDQALLEFISPNICQDVPTSVGFCMAINNKFLRRVPQFDTVFGKGYGEEVDWCQRVSALKGLHKAVPNLYVEHRGGSSFGDAHKRAAIAKNNQLVAKRYPSFDQRVQHFIADDPLRTIRLFAGIVELASSSSETPIYIAHSMGGGAELYLQEQIKQRIMDGEGVVVLRVGGALRWRIELHTQQGVIFGDTDDTRLVHKILKPLTSAHIIYSCAVGDRDPFGLTQEIEVLARSKAGRFSFLVHDYFALSPSYCLLGSNNTYRGVDPQAMTDTKHMFQDVSGKLQSNALWRDCWGKLLNISDSIICFSSSSAKLMVQAFPEIVDFIVTRPHAISTIQKMNAPSSPDALTIGVLGDIGVQKGAQVLSDLSRQLRLKKNARIVVIGRVDPQFELGQNCIETGPFKRRDITMLAEKHQISEWLIPSIWPETFSYTTHEALATGAPVFCFDLGAQGEAVDRAENGYSMPLEWAGKPHKIISEIEKVHSHGSIDQYRHRAPKSGRDRGFAA